MNLRDQLTALGPLQARLDDIDTKLSTMIVRIEELLRGHLSVRITTPMPGGDLLMFGKHNGFWRLLVEHRGSTTALVECSRELRAAAFQGRHIEQLILDANAQLTDQIERRNEAIKAADRISTLLAGGGS